MGRPSEAVGHLERAARFWADLPANPFADFSDLVQAVAATGDFDRAHRLADVAIEKTRSWPRPLAEAKLGKAQVLAMQLQYAEAASVLRDALEQPEILGGGRIILGALLIDCLYLGQLDASDIPSIIDSIRRGPIDTRLRLRFDIANSVAKHRAGTCNGECQEALSSVQYWATKGMVATTLNASLKLAHMAFEHRDRRAVARAVPVLTQLRDSELVRMNRGWVRLLAPAARRIAAMAGGAGLVADFVDADPEGWRLNAVEALSVVKHENRKVLLDAIVRNANRETTSLLHAVPGADVADAWRQLQVKQAPRIFVRLLGPLVVHRGSSTGPTVSISKRRMRGMLGLLASHLGRPMSRDQVIETLWPDADYTAGVNNLNQTVFQLRRELDPSHREGESAPYLISTPETVQLHPDLVRTDMHEVRRQAARLNDGPLVRRREAAEAILSLVRGEFLQELRYEPWSAPIQVRVHAELAGYLRPLIHADGVEISHEIGVRAACALLSLDEFDESAHFALIRQLARSGKRRAARIEADRYVERLRTDLDEEPSTDLEALLASLGIANVSTAV
jgi:DNA-binding SARP family transcriptional activator